MLEHLRFTGGALAGRPMRLAPFQRDNIVRPIFGTLDARGRRVYREALVGLPRWGGKSQLSAALGLTLMYTEPTFEGEYYVVATTKQQAGIVFEKAKRMVLMDDLLRGITRVYRNVLEIQETGALFRVLPWDADTAQGYHPTAAIIDEYHVHRDSSMREAHALGHGGRRPGTAHHDLDRRAGAQGSAVDAAQATCSARTRVRTPGRRAGIRAPTSTGPALPTRPTGATRRSGAPRTRTAGSPRACCATSTARCRSRSLSGST